VRPSVLSALFFASGAAALTYEVLWMRRVALLLGSGSLAVTLTLAVFFGALGLGGLAAWAWRPRQPLRAYGALELGIGGWALALPAMLGLGATWALDGSGLARPLVVVLATLGPPAAAMGATLPVVAGAGLTAQRVGRLYGINTAGAVLGVLATPAVLLPLLGVRGSEVLAAGLSIAVGGIALRSERAARSQRTTQGGALALSAIFAAAVSGGVAMSLEVSWTRLAALLLGPSIHAFAWVLAVFLGGVALGAAWGSRPGDLARPLGLLGLLAVLGTWSFGQAPTWLAGGYDLVGPSGLWAIQLVLSAVAMAGAPVASGVVFARAIAAAGGGTSRATALVLGANTLAGVVGAACTGLWLLPALGLPGVVHAAALVAALAAAILARPGWLVAAALAVAVAPAWQGKLHAVGIHQRVSDLGDRRPEAVRAFAEEGWELLSYEQGRTAAVAVGRSTRTGNLWLSINGKVDASTGVDMPTQLLSGVLPARMSGQPRQALVVGLASGVTSGALLDEGVEALWVVEIEPAVVSASRAFDAVSGAPLDDPRTHLIVDDARTVLQRPGPAFDVIVSEPSNPWITGVSNLFTREYWELGRARLAPGGVFCQWIQLYGLRTPELRSLVRTFTEVFGEAWLVETVPGADVLLLAGPPPPPDWPRSPTLGPRGLSVLGLGARLNTDDRPWVELAAPRAVHLATAEDNAALIHRIADGQP